MGPINNIPVLVQIMAWRLSGDKPLSEQWLLVYWRIYVSFGLNELMDLVSALPWYTVRGIFDLNTHPSSNRQILVWRQYHHALSISYSESTLSWPTIHNRYKWCIMIYNIGWKIHLRSMKICVKNYYSIVLIYNILWQSVIGKFKTAWS